MRRSKETLTKIAAPTAAAIGGFVVGKALRANKLRQLRAENKRLKHEVAHDDLTGLLTKKELIKRGDERLRKAAPGQTFVLVQFDLDNFKAVNDKHHRKYDEGDDMLKTFAQVLRENVRVHDAAPDMLARGSREDGEEDAARLGGDEFAGLFEVTPRGEKGAHMSPLQRANAFCSRIRENFQSRYNDRPDIQALGGVDVSMGVVVRQPGEMMESMISRAATPLGEVKQQHHAENGSYR